jgi:heptosyltransferase-2
VVLGFSEFCTERKRVLNRGYDRFYTHVLDDFRLVHEVEHNLGLVTAMNGLVFDRRVAIEIAEPDAVRAEQLLAPVRRHRPLLAIAPFASEPKRCIPVDEIEAIAGPLLDGLFASVVVIGGTAERREAERLAVRLGPRAISLAGRCSVCQAAAVIGRCDAMIAADSGPAHIAAALGTPVVVLSCHAQDGRPGHENSPLRFSPWGETSRILVLQPENAVEPCEDGCTATEPHCLIESIRGGERRLVEFLQQAPRRVRQDRLPAREPHQFPAG